MKRIAVIIILLIVIFSCCKRNYNEDFAVGSNITEDNQKIQQENIDRAFTNANKVINLKEQENIKAFIQRTGWAVQEKDGMYIHIISGGEGNFITDKNNVKVSYSVSLLNGEKYSKDSINVKEFSAKGDTEIPFGLVTAMKYLKKKTHAYIILPSAMGYTISDEGEKIKQDNTLIYDIKVLEVR